MKTIPEGAWQMSLAMLISGSIGAFVLLSGMAVIDVVFWRCLIGAFTLFLFIRFSKQPLRRIPRTILLLAIAGELRWSLTGCCCSPLTAEFQWGWRQWSTTRNPLCWC